MKLHLALTCLLTTLVAGSVARAASPQFQNLSQDDVDKISKDFAANTTLHSVLPPSSLGSIFGFELGVAGGLTSSPNIDEQAKRVDANTSVPKIPHAGIVGAVSTPIGVTAEAVYLPKYDTGDFKYTQMGLALKWNLTDYIIPLPAVNIALRGFLSKSEFNFKQTTTYPVIGSQTMNISNTNQVTGLQILASPKLIPIIEPYIGIGFLSAKTDISKDPSLAPLFANGSDSASSSPTTTQFLVGLDARLLVIGLGLEYSKEFGNDSLTGKFSFKF